jgi:hypothetical protein
MPPGVKEREAIHLGALREKPKQALFRLSARTKTILPAGVKLFRRDVT